MSAAHTPGPWEAHQGIDSSQPSVWDVVTKQDNWSPNDLTPEGWFVATVHEVRDEPSAQANARLIAAAPELLEALEKLAAFADEVTGKVEPPLYPIAYAWEVIAKARGEA